MNHPLEFIPAPRRKPLFWLFFALTLTIFGVFQALDTWLKTRAAPAGIITFEFARNAHEAGQIIGSWSLPARISAAFGLGLDYLFMPVYALAWGWRFCWPRANFQRDAGKPWAIGSAGASCWPSPVMHSKTWAFTWR